MKVPEKKLQSGLRSGIRVFFDKAVQQPVEGGVPREDDFVSRKGLPSEDEKRLVFAKAVGGSLEDAGGVEGGVYRHVKVARLLGGEGGAEGDGGGFFKIDLHEGSEPGMGAGSDLRYGVRPGSARIGVGLRGDRARRERRGAGEEGKDETPSRPRVGGQATRPPV